MPLLGRLDAEGAAAWPSGVTCPLLGGAENCLVCVSSGVTVVRFNATSAALGYSSHTHIPAEVEGCGLYSAVVARARMSLYL